MAKYLLVILMLPASLFAGGYDCSNGTITLDEYGTVTYGGKVYTGNYQVTGLTKRWDFSDGIIEVGDRIPYSIIIYPNNIGHYFQFSDDYSTHKSLSSFICTFI